MNDEASRRGKLQLDEINLIFKSVSYNRNSNKVSNFYDDTVSGSKYGAGDCILKDFYRMDSGDLGISQGSKKVVK